MNNNNLYMGVTVFNERKFRATAIVDVTVTINL